MVRKYLLLAFISLCVWQGLASAEKRTLTVVDAVSTRRLAGDGLHGEVAISPDGAQIAYILKAPDIRNNTNNYELLIKRLGEDAKAGNGRLLLRADRLAGLQWLDNSRGVLVIETQGRYPAEHDRLILIDTRSREREVIESPTKSIRSFSVDKDATRIVFCAAVGRLSNVAERDIQNRYGFRVIPGQPIQDPALIDNWHPDSFLYLAEKNAGGRRKLTRLRAIAPSGEALERFTGEVTNLALSPNGNFLLFKYTTQTLPTTWQGGFYATQQQSSAFPMPLWGLLNINDRRFELGFDAPAFSYISPVWSSDSKSFALSALPPEGTSLEREDLRDGFSDLKWQWESFLHLFVVDVRTRAVSETLHRFKGRAGSNIGWGRTNNALLVTLETGELIRLERTSVTWIQTRRAELFTDPSVRIQGITRSGRFAIGLREDISMPPNLVVGDLISDRTHVITDWNPEYENFALGEIEKISWVNKYGVKCSGYLIKPVGYTSAKKYPLVVMNRARESFFVSDGSYTTAFPPQVLAGHGFAVLMTEYFFDVKELPQGFPGGLAEAYNWMAMVESGIDTLVSRGIVDRARVGLIGFSRTSWKTDFMLTHSDFQFAAVSSADGGIYNYGSYWFHNHSGVMNDAESVMGGPPYGKTLDNWLKYAPAFNASNVRCPLLMEYTGHGHLPYGPIGAFEFFTALYRQDKPVELYFYPLGDHPLDTPLERVASLQRNVDWFRFWIQSYEGQSPSYDPDQFQRWRELRKTEAAE
ncbi:MAG: prolyl oligopeptidase family serine peptidase [Terriglobia bacterium]|nr:prolyl oligopeptidase family serine peptidase [Terriglobia bacterium]